MPSLILAEANSHRIIQVWEIFDSIRAVRSTVFQVRFSTNEETRHDKEIQNGGKNC